MEERSSVDTLNFEQASFEGGVGPSLVCTGCSAAPTESYFSVNGNPTCKSCLETAQQAQKSSFFKALLLGTCAGAVGALVYYGIREVTGYDLALITIVVGVVVGMGVRMGAGHSTSIMYRLMAVALTWVAMCATYVPAIAAETEAGGYVTAAVIAMGVPIFLAMDAQLLGVLIFGFGLWEAWSKSAPSAFEVEGPFELSSAKPAEPVILALPTRP